MQVRRRQATWFIRWRVEHEIPSARVHSSPTLCRFCDDDADWMEMTDFAAMPAPSTVNRCDQCGSATAYAALPIDSTTWDEAPRRRYPILS